MSAEASRLGQILKKELSYFQQFEQLLNEECQALVNGPAESLLTIVNQKAVMAETLNQLAQERIDALKNLGIDAVQADAVNQWFDERHAKDDLRVNWQQLREIGRSIVVRNEANGDLIRRRLEATQDTLHVLQKAAGSPGLYGPDGKVKNPFTPKGY